MLIDTHCHLDFKDFDSDRDKVIARSTGDGISVIINVGSSLEGSKKSLELSEKYPNIYASLGIHPHHADEATEETLKEFKLLFNNTKKIAAVGEIGLDYYRNLSSKENQKKLFIDLLEEAKKRDLPVIIHNREAHSNTLSILKDVLGNSIKGVMHCFSGDKDFLEECLNLGLFVSFTCNVTFKKADNLREIIKFVPMDKLLLETDAPFLAPQIFRGKRNEPSYIKYLAREIANIKKINIEEIEHITTENTKKLFAHIKI